MECRVGVLVFINVPGQELLSYQFVAPVINLD